MEEYLLHIFFLGAVFIITGLIIGAIAPADLIKPALIGVGVLATATILAKMSLKYRDDLPPDDSEQSL